MNKEKRITVRFPRNIYELLRKKSYEERISINKIIIEILEKELEK